jgi:Tol biopolymer transport system component
MSQQDDFDRSVARWFESDARPAATADVLDRALAATRRRHPRPRLYATLWSHWIGDGAATSSEAMLWRTGVQTATALVVLLLVLVLMAGVVAVGARLLQRTPVDLGIFAPVAGRIVYGDERGIWGIDPTAPADSATRVQLTSEAGIPLGWSSDGTRLLIMRGSDPDEHLFVLHTDGSAVQVTEGPWSIRGATISPDGSRVVFAGVTGDTGSAPYTGLALYAVDADGGRAKRLGGQGPGDGLIQQPTFSPDGTRIAYAMGAGDHSNSVWLVDADGSSPRPIVWNESDEWPGHVRGLSWSPAGNRIALGLGGKIYTFATDGSGVTQIAGADTGCGPADPCAVKLPRSAESPYWSPDGSQIAYTTGCVEGAGAANRVGCHLAIADADGSSVRTFGFPTSGPWHPAQITSDAPSSAPIR